jgi:hypothetical protein
MYLPDVIARNRTNGVFFSPFWMSFLIKRGGIRDLDLFLRVISGPSVEPGSIVEAQGKWIWNAHNDLIDHNQPDDLVTIVETTGLRDRGRSTHG